MKRRELYHGPSGSLSTCPRHIVCSEQPEGPDQAKRGFMMSPGTDKTGSLGEREETLCPRFCQVSLAHPLTAKSTLFILWRLITHPPLPAKEEILMGHYQGRDIIRQPPSQEPRAHPDPTPIFPPLSALPKCLSLFADRGIRHLLFSRTRKRFFDSKKLR